MDCADRLMPARRVSKRANMTTATGKIPLNKDFARRRQNYAV